MNQFVAITLPPRAGDEGRGGIPAIPATLSPYERFAAETQRRYQILTDAGIEEDLAFECASWAAMTKVAGTLNADDYEFCNNVYGDF